MGVGDPNAKYQEMPMNPLKSWMLTGLLLCGASALWAKAIKLDEAPVDPCQQYDVCKNPVGAPWQCCNQMAEHNDAAACACLKCVYPPGTALGGPCAGGGDPVITPPNCGGCAPTPNNPSVCLMCAMQHQVNYASCCDSKS